jgi:mannose-6-phosphate isomerase-like protein (cupin superfamily)
VQANDFHELLARRAASERPYLEFLRGGSLSVGLYVLGVGATDRQQPHTEDEVYYVVAGRSRMTVGNSEIDVAPGSVIFVEAQVPHRFHDIAEELQIVVFFAPPEGSLAESR